MNNFLMVANKFFNRLLIASVLIFIGFCLAGCASRPNHATQGQETDTVPSNARHEYESLRGFKAKNKAFYTQLKK
jgi:hypothetical protein